MSRKNPGRLVELKDGRKGIIYNNEAPIEGKYRVYIVNDKYEPLNAKVLKKAEDLKVIGYTD